MKKKHPRISGFTLVEVIISISIMMIIMIITGSMLISGLNILYYDAESLQQKNIGDAACKLIAESIMYSNGDDSDEIIISDGKLYIKYAGESSATDAFGDEFYNGYTVGYSADIREKWAAVTVDVYDEDNETVYSAKKSVIIMNK